MSQLSGEPPERPQVVALNSSRERLLNVREVAAWLDVSTGWVRDHATGRRRPLLPVVRLGKLLRFRAADVERFLGGCQAMAREGGWQEQPIYRRAA